jgi:hypothetical protein
MEAAAAEAHVMLTSSSARVYRITGPTMRNRTPLPNVQGTLVFLSLAALIAAIVVFGGRVTPTPRTAASMLTGMFVGAWWVIFTNLLRARASAAGPLTTVLLIATLPPVLMLALIATRQFDGSALAGAGFVGWTIAIAVDYSARAAAAPGTP